MPPKRKAAAAAATSDSKKKDTRPAALIENEDAATARGLAMGFKEEDLRFQYVLKAGKSLRNRQSDDNDDDDDDDDDDDGGGVSLTTKAQFDKTWCLVTTVHWGDEMNKIIDAFLRVTGNEPGDVMLMFNTHSGNCAIDFVALQGRRIKRLVKTKPQQAFWEMYGLLQAMSMYESFVHDHEFDAEDFATAMRDVAAASRAVLRAPLADMKVDEINLNVFRQLSDKVGKMINEDSLLAEEGITVKWN
jgi:hypothetical protein